METPARDPSVNDRFPLSDSGGKPVFPLDQSGTPAEAEQRSRVSERRAAQAAVGETVEADNSDGDIPHLGEGDPAAGGMTVSVTRHAPFSEPREWKFLACNVDTLDLGVFIIWGPPWVTLQPELEKLKAQACGTTGVLWGNGSALVLPSGKPPQYRYHLKYPDFELYLGIADLPLGRTPNAYVSISAQLLWHKGVLDCVRRIQSVVESLGGQVLRVQPSRADLAADFLIPGGLSLAFLLAHRVPAQISMTPILAGDQLETFYVGAKKSPIQLRIYKKSLEISRNPLKAWMWGIWGLSGSEDVLRIEFQIRRQVLREMKIEEAQNLIDCAAGLWDYLTGQWFSLRYPDNPNPTRRTVHPFWQHVQNVAPHFGTMCTVQRQRSNRSPDVSRCLAQIYGHFVSLSALSNWETQPEALRHLIENLQEQCRSRDFEHDLQIRRIKFGQDNREQRDDVAVIETEFP